MDISRKIQIFFFVFTFLALEFSCNQSTFTGSTSKKKSTSSAKNNEIEISTEGDSPEIEDISNPESEETVCFEEPLPFAPTVTEPNQLWEWHASGPTTQYTQVMATPVIGMLGNTLSIVFSAFVSSEHDPSYTYAIDAKTGAQRWVSTIFVYSHASAALGDIDNDHVNEVAIFGKDNYIYALDDQGNQKWKSSVPIASINPYWAIFHIVMSELEDYGKAVVIAGGKVFDGKDGHLLFEIPGIDTIVFDVNNSPGKEVITSQGIFRSKDGSELCLFPLSLWGLAAGRLKAEDDYLTVIGKNGPNGDTIYGFKGSNCTKVLETPANPGGTNSGGPINLADFDGDSELEIGVTGEKYYSVFDTDGKVLWSSPVSEAGGSVTGSTTFDFNGDGRNEIVYNDQHYLRVYDGQKGTILYQIENPSSTNEENPIIVDINNDHHAEIIVSSNNYAYPSVTHYGIRVFAAPDNSWIGTRPIWNQHAYSITNVADSGAIVGINPETIWKKWVKSEHLLGFRNNLPIRPTKKCE